MRLSYRQFALLFAGARVCSSKSFDQIGRTPGFVINHSRDWTQTRRRMATTIPTGTSNVDDNSVASTFQCALCQFHVTHDKQKNIETAKNYLTRAAEAGSKMAVMPEIWNSPYATAAFPEYAEKLPDIGDEDASDESPSAKLLFEAAKAHNMYIVGGSIPEIVKNTDGKDKIYNTCLVISPNGKVVAKHRKVHLFDIDVPGGITFFESETLSPGENVSVFTTPFGNVGVGICYDIRFAEYAMLLRQKYDCNVIVYPGAFNLTTGPAHWELLQRARALDNQCFILTASPARTTEPAADSKYPHYTAWGHSTAVSPWGDVLATVDEKEGVVIANLQLSELEKVRKGIPIGNQRREDIYKVLQVQQK